MNNDRYLHPGPDVNAFTLRKLDCLDKILGVWTNNGLDNLKHQQLVRRIHRIFPELAEGLDQAEDVTYAEDLKEQYI